MNQINTKLIVFGAIGLVAFFFALVFAGIIPGLKKNPSNVASVEGELSMWVLNSQKSDYDTALGKFNSLYSGVSVNIRTFTDEAAYKNAILQSLAVGNGPDIFMVDNAEIGRESNKIVPLSTQRITLSKMQELFPRVVESDFVSGGNIYALPLSVNTLVMLYNKDVLDSRGVAQIPKTWEEFKAMVYKVAEIDSSKRINIAAAAIGGSEKNIDKASDLVQLIMMQAGVSMVKSDFSGASFSTPAGENAVRFYTGFSDAKNKEYTWNSSMPAAIDSFAEGKTAVMFNYKSAIKEMLKKNQWLNIGIAPVPYPEKANCKNEYDCKTAYARYFGYAVSRQSKLQGAAWDLILTMTTESDSAESYMQKTKNPPALRSLINKVYGDPEFSAEARQALIAKSWSQPDRAAISGYFSNMIDVITSGATEINSALRQAEDSVTRLFQNK
ncbi:MAG: ABC transporter, solute-binding protein [Candidatus Jorgensenbacteria bacterium GW2011_GWA2_45_9]|uniref:ABC transporter, solute-binding protein n=1 Tax=Candidatus Jorgensenbacteria bacterium GW2011_GWA2_45_9 TaxID=1618663 RepID=A0A0G1N5S9_9BACT|nr:MAG: ABC transporter, solute-binding protein [Candidatus Jorgensenbacteria bacterium GW2011_GWA2_45_9]